jgi:hypothetical protein
MDDFDDIDSLLDLESMLQDDVFAGELHSKVTASGVAYSSRTNPSLQVPPSARSMSSMPRLAVNKSGFGRRLALIARRSLALYLAPKASQSGQPAMLMTRSCWNWPHWPTLHSLWASPAPQSTRLA